MYRIIFITSNEPIETFQIASIWFQLKNYHVKRLPSHFNQTTLFRKIFCVCFAVLLRRLHASFSKAVVAWICSTLCVTLEVYIGLDSNSGIDYGIIWNIHLSSHITKHDDARHILHILDPRYSQINSILLDLLHTVFWFFSCECSWYISIWYGNSWKLLYKNLFTQNFVRKAQYWYILVARSFDRIWFNLRSNSKPDKMLFTIIS